MGKRALLIAISSIAPIPRFFKQENPATSTMALGQDAMPGPALAGRLLRALGLPLHQRGNHYSYHGVSDSGPDAIALELAPWPSSPVVTELTTPTSIATTTTTDGSTTYDLDSCECDLPQATGRRCYNRSSLGNLQGHTRANSLDSTTTSSSTTSSASSLSPTPSSRWEKPGHREPTTADRKAKYIEARRRKESTELWRQYW
ncbi:hypothetical protein CGRA01v4_14722 [Colletotrichum graminicola]|nr:hypothetical protein CGRA01v4_14722 [Colletotrichum graminicola]